MLRETCQAPGNSSCCKDTMFASHVLAVLLMEVSSWLAMLQVRA